MIKNWNAFNEANEIKKEGICICKDEPLGNSGLEGFNSGEEYKYQLKTDTKGKNYYKIYHDDEYSQTCGVNTFKKYFTIKSYNESFKTIVNSIFGKKTEYEKAYDRLEKCGIEGIFTEPSNMMYHFIKNSYNEKYPNNLILDDIHLLRSHLQKKYFGKYKSDEEKKEILAKSISFVSKFYDFLKVK